MRSLPTSTNAALGSKIGKGFAIVDLHVELSLVRLRLGLITSRGSKSLQREAKLTKMCD
jgi:hypothetical protein